jgi:DUF1680 family protein
MLVSGITPLTHLVIFGKFVMKSFVHPLTRFARAGLAVLALYGLADFCSAQDTPANLAVVATASSSYVSGDTSLDALSDEFEPENSRDARRGSYGNWNRTGTQWVQYQWTQPISTDAIEVYWWDDRRGVRLPVACRLLYARDGKLEPVPNAEGLGVAGDRFNRTTFGTVSTDQLRLEIDSNGEFSTGILEWRVWDSGESPVFAPRVNAGVDRVAVRGGRTFLSGTLRAVTPLKSGTPVEWSKVSGPGEVAFDNSHMLETTAAVDVAGNYILQLEVKVGDQVGRDTLEVQVVEPRVAEPLQPVETRQFEITSPLWRDRAKSLIVHWIPHCVNKISDPALQEGGINNFVQAANKLAGRDYEPHRGYVFSNAWVLNTVEAICLALQVDPQGDTEILTAQQQLRQTLEDWIPKILAAQEPDGYLQTVFTLSDRQRWSPRHRDDHEGYVAGYFIDAAITHYEMTGRQDDRLYQAARRLADCWDANIGPAPKREWFDGHQAMEMALVRLGRYVNEVEASSEGDRYVALAKFLLDCRRDGHSYDQSHLPVIEQYEALGHAVRAVYTYTAMADVVLELGDIDYQSAVMSLWDNIVNRKYYVTGGVGSGETSEGFGPDYSLRHDGYCESCSSCGELYFQHRLNRAYADAKYADLYEETLYNALLGSIDLAGKNFYYQNPLDARGNRYPWHGCPCCVGNIPRTLLMLPTWTYLKSKDAIYVNLFVGSRVVVDGVAGTNVELVQETNYPWDGKVKITVAPQAAGKFALMVRSPQRDVSSLYAAAPAADGVMKVTVNRQPVQPETKQGYLAIERTWQAGDTVEFELPLAVQRVRGDQQVEATRGQVALRYGPLMYCVESTDQTLGGKLAPSADLSTKWRADLLNGVQVIEGTWSDGSQLLAIPYYSRMNRSESDQPGRRGRTRAEVWIDEE